MLYVFVYMAHRHITDSPPGHHPSLGMFQRGGPVCSSRVFGGDKAGGRQITQSGDQQAGHPMAAGEPHTVGKTWSWRWGLVLV